jgi:hypothetical protein
MPTMPSTPDVNFEGAQTMSLQRMFEHTATAAPRRAAAPAPSAPAWPSTVVTQGDGYTEVTWPQPAVQREADTPGPEPAPEPAPATDQPADTPPEPGTGTAAPQSVSTATTTAQASAGAPGTNLDELVQRLYDPLAARLRAELWQDRERAGALMDLRR